MLKKFLLPGVIAGTLLLAASSSFAPSDAAAIHPNQGLASASAESGLVDLVLRYRLRRTRAAAGIGVFIVPGLYWGPAWWDPIYARVCWKPYRPCRNCAQNWIYVC